MGTDRIRRLRHGASACVRRIWAPGHPCWSQQGCVAKTHREAERCVIASSTHPTGYRLISLRALSDLCGSIPPVLSLWSIPPGELITLAPKKLIRTRRASEGSASEPSLARRVSMC